MKPLHVVSPGSKVYGVIRLPSSKSISNRALIIQSLCIEKFEILNLSEADDTRLMQQLLKQISELSGTEERLVELDCRNAGTVLRFLASFLSVIPGKWLLKGLERMHQRPVGILVDALRNLGAKITYLADTGYPPLLITGTSLNGSIIDLNSSISSQFISSILLISPQFPKGLTINLTNRIVSAPYIDMTLKLMKYFGVNSVISQGKIAVKHQAYRPETIIVEPDWSSASFWYEITALAENPEIFIEGLKKNSIQGDAVLPEIYRNLGVRTEYLFDGIRITKTNRLTDHFEFDFTHYPDLALPVIATCAGLGIRGFFTGLENLTIKETNRLEALNKELNEMGFGSRIVAGNGLEISGKKRDSFPDKVHLTKSYGDHRMAMSFAPLAILFGEMLIDEPEVISKSYPGFWNEIKKVGFLTDLIV